MNPNNMWVAYDRNGNISLCDPNHKVPGAFRVYTDDTDAAEYVGCLRLMPPFIGKLEVCTDGDHGAVPVFRRYEDGGKAPLPSPISASMADGSQRDLRRGDKITFTLSDTNTPPQYYAAPGISLIPPEFEYALGEVYKKGAQKFGNYAWCDKADDIDWLRGRMENFRRHLNNFTSPLSLRKLDEDDLAAMAWWLSVLVKFRDDLNYADTIGYALASGAMSFGPSRPSKTDAAKSADIYDVGDGSDVYGPHG
jgi:hypothetical protein